MYENTIVKHIGTKLAERLARGDKGINGLDELCKEHDIAYATHKDSSERRVADKKLAKGAFRRLFSKNASLGERAASLLVTSAMGAKTGILGMGFSCTRKPSRKSKKSKQMSFATLVKDAKKGMKKYKAKNVNDAIIAAIRSANNSKKGKNVSVPRIIKVPSISGGILPILPILAGLSAVGSLVGSATGVVKTIKDINNAKQQLEENKRHNRAMEMKIGSGLYLGLSKSGSGLYLRPYKGEGLYLKPFSKNYH